MFVDVTKVFFCSFFFYQFFLTFQSLITTYLLNTLKQQTLQVFTATDFQGLCSQEVIRCFG